MSRNLSETQQIHVMANLYYFLWFNKMFEPLNADNLNRQE